MQTIVKIIKVAAIVLAVIGICAVMAPAIGWAMIMILGGVL